jgi:hypothetical protein
LEGAIRDPKKAVPDIDGYRDIEDIDIDLVVSDLR